MLAAASQFIIPGTFCHHSLRISAAGQRVGGFATALISRFQGHAKLRSSYPAGARLRSNCAGCAKPVTRAIVCEPNGQFLRSGSGPATKDPYRKGASLGVGPLRLWPGGLCLSRAIGDFDVGDAVLSLPYICQVLCATSLSNLSPSASARA